MLNSSIPIIDISAYLLGASVDGHGVVDDIRSACEEIGFFIITGHQVPASLIDNIYNAGRTFFALPDDQKRQICTSGAVKGGVTYVPFAVEKLAATLGKITPGDLKESLNFGKELTGAEWPDVPPALHQVFHEYFNAMQVLSRHIRAMFAEAIGLPSDYFEAAFVDCTSAVRVLNYPAQKMAPEPGQLRAGAHSDYGFVTILLTDDAAGGLQARHRNGQWLDVPTVDGGFVVNIGDAMMRWTNDRWISTVHRVINPPSDERSHSRRQSMAFFLNPNPQAEIRCLDAFCSEANPAKYPPITWQKYIEQKSQAAGA